MKGDESDGEERVEEGTGETTMGEVRSLLPSSPGLMYSVRPSGVTTARNPLVPTMYSRPSLIVHCLTLFDLLKRMSSLSSSLSNPTSLSLFTYSLGGQSLKSKMLCVKSFALITHIALLE